MRFILPVLLLLFGGLPAIAGSITHVIEFDPALVTIKIDNEWNIVEYPGMELRGEPGAPLLPVFPVVFLLPNGAENVSFQVSAVNESSISRPGIRVIPATEPRPFSRNSDPSIRLPQPQIYTSNSTWPSDPVLWTHTGTISGFRIASCLLQPWKYLPADGQLSLLTEIEVTVFWDEGIPTQLSIEQNEVARRRIRSLIDNTDMIPVYEPLSKASGDAEYLIVCDSFYTDILQPLADLQERHGRTVEIAAVHEIIENFSGRDDAEKLRNFIRDRFLEHGTVFVFLAGDETLVPVRLVELFCEGYSDISPVDLYFADLDGSWDGNGDGRYGQPDDDLDLYADVLLGRALFSTSREAAIFVQKNITYQTTATPEDWPSRAVLCGAVLFEDIGYTGAKGCDSIAVTMPASWEITKAYEILYGDGIDTHIPIISSGTGWNHYAGHGSKYGTGIFWSSAPMGMMTNWIATDSLNNGKKTGIHTSIACHPAKYVDTECCAEALLNAPDGGGVAVMFNTSYGWEGFWPSLGASEWMCIDLARQVFWEHSSSIGLAFSIAKDLRIPYMHGGYDRTFQCLLSWSAFMDPALIVRQSHSEGPVPPVPLTVSPPYPNPAKRDAPIAFYVDYSAGSAEVSVHDFAGRLIWETTIFSPQRVSWEGTNQEGRRVPAGVYIISVRRGNYIRNRLTTVLN
ncbi:MAG: hypothetical protein KAW14_06030 [Candidatus Aegiribacteria sp.]|nr:hypothetical protein [Candidatus Aegiribacteria sp.]